MEGDDRRYEGLKAPTDDSLFAASDPLDVKNAKYLIVASSDYLYTPPRSLFLARCDLAWQSVYRRLSVWSRK